LPQGLRVFAALVADQSQQVNCGAAVRGLFQQAAVSCLGGA
jgi:hypothetical protein